MQCTRSEFRTSSWKCANSSFHASGNKRYIKLWLIEICHIGSGTIKGLSTEQLLDDALSPEIILGNTYHLALQPGTELLAELGGLHKFMNWKNNLLTDSGGFQMVSLLDLAEV